MLARPTDPWPRSQGHVVLAWPGSRTADKAYHEPGGNFSPGFGSFGVSFWFVDKENQIQTTSETVSLDQIDQRWIWREDALMPDLLTEAPCYSARWSMVQPGVWRLQLKIQQAETNTALVVIRSVGPAGGPVRSLDWKDHRLTVNRRWTLSTAPPITNLFGGHEGDAGWITSRQVLTNWTGTDGWGYALLVPPNQQDWTIQIQDTTPVPPTQFTSRRMTTAVQMDLPETWFSHCLNAQLVQMLMGSVGWETRSGDPASCSTFWVRDSAFIVTALARAGLVEAARQLCRTLSEQDFAGGYGPEADAPGLALWGLGEVTGYAQDPQLIRMLWPSVQRKAEEIVHMRSTQQPIFLRPTGPVLPRFAQHRELGLVCEAARDGLIVGRVDWKRPLFYANAVSYRGFIGASWMASWMGNSVAAENLRSLATDLQRAWQLHPLASEALDDHAAISALWPTWFISNRASFAERLRQRWLRDRDTEGRPKIVPEHPYAVLAETHQWLFLNQPQPVWATLRWFHDHQASKGLFTWWDTFGETNAFRGWDPIRGWVNPVHVTPHYRVAAEMALLQLDMLAYVDESDSRPVLVVGGGIPQEWLSENMSVRGIQTQLGIVDWAWQNQHMSVRVHGQPCAIRLGASFPAQSLVPQFGLP